MLPTRWPARRQNGIIRPVDRIISALLDRFSESYGFSELPQDKQFERFANYCVVATRGAEETFDVEELTVDGAETGIDGLAIQVNGRIVTDPEEIEGLAEQNRYLEVDFMFVQAKTSESFQAAAMEMMGRAAKDFFSESPSLPQTPFLTRSRQIFDEIYKRAHLFTRRNPNVHLFMVTTGTWNDPPEIAFSMKSIRDELLATRYFKEVGFEAIDAETLAELFRRANEPVESRFKFERKATIPTGIPGIESAYLGVVEGAEFLRLVEDDQGRIRSSLFEDNVRDFQGEDNTVNAQMAATVESDESGRFPVLNNGVTLIAREIQTVGDEVIVRDYQIVNGCQTANVIHAHRDHASQEGFWVPLKVVATQDDDLITEIVTATNSQSPVRAEELGSRSRFERKLEQFFEAADRESRSIRYERRSRQYANDSSVAAARVITRRILVRSYVSLCLDQPHRATGYVTTLFKQMGTEHFEEGDRPEPYYTSALAHYRLDNMFAQYKIARALKPARWHLLMAFRHLVLEGEPLAPPNSGRVATQMDKINHVLEDDERTLKTFTQAAELLNEALPDSSRDVLRSERSTERLREALAGVLGAPTARA